MVLRAADLGQGVTMHPGDCLDVLTAMEPDSVDACVTDPPYHLTSQIATTRSAFPGRYAGTKGASMGFMGKQWDGGDIAFRSETWAAVLRVLKPGAHLLAFGGTRTYHRMACAIEDAGFEVRDCCAFLYGSGFPKSHDAAQSIEKLLTTGSARRPDRDLGGLSRNRFSGDIEGGLIANTGGKVPLTQPEAIEWEGWGTALKPAMELICLARKPLSEGTIAANVLKWGTGAINVDGCRIATDESLNGGAYAEAGGRTESQSLHAGSGMNIPGKTVGSEFRQPSGRWPANIIHDGSDEVVGAFPETGASVGGGRNNGNKFGREGWASEPQDEIGFGDSGSAARFFYTSKADSDDRLGSKHPTVKPVDLIQYLCRLVTPKGGLVLDPFAGTGTLGEACIREGMRAVLIEREEEYQTDIRRRMKLAMSGPDERMRETAKARDPEPDPGPLFTWEAMWKKPYEGPA
jgi:DNA modification methylase